MKDFLFGKRKKYRIQTDVNNMDIGGRSYSMKHGRLTVKDGFSKVATFTNFKYITEV